MKMSELIDDTVVETIGGGEGGYYLIVLVICEADEILKLDIMTFNFGESLDIFAQNRPKFLRFAPLVLATIPSRLLKWEGV